VKSKLLDHFSSITFVTAILLFAVWAIGVSQKINAKQEASKLKGLTDITFIDFSDPFQRALLKDALNIYYPGQYDKNDSLARAIISLKEQQFSDKLQKSHLTQALTPVKWIELIIAYAKFLIVYVIVMFLTYYGVQTIAVARFVLKKSAAQRVSSNLVGTFFTKACGLFFTFILFCPAYVIAYSIRTELNTDTIFFMILLATVSNGLLITYANKFFAFLTAESRKGYVETAIVKNLIENYRTSDPGIPWKSILSLRKRYPGHVFDHIYRNARFQYVSTLKEQASFLISGLVIIEMALNIHGHLSYEMLRQMLYKNYDIVIIIVLGIFYTVKMTEIFTDLLLYRESRKYENRTG